MNDVVYVRDTHAIQPRTTREWTRLVHGELEYLLPYEDRRMGPLTTEELTDGQGRPVDVLAHFKKHKKYLHTLIGNAVGIAHTAQVTGDTSCIEEPAPPWEGFEDIWVPVGERLKLSARVGWARKNGRILKTDCIVLLPGLLGDNMRVRARDIGQLLTSAGHHVLSLEFRGHGQTEANDPSVAYNFGVLETGDLLEVAKWLEAKPHVTGTGMVGFSWSANIGLLAAWENGRSEGHPSVSARLQPHMRPRDGRIYYQSGIFAISPVFDLENIADALERPWSMSANPILNAIQGTINRRAERRGYSNVNGSLRRLIECEYARSELSYPEAMADGFDYLRFLPYKGRPTGAKLNDAKVPILMLHASSDPLAYAQEIADVIAETKNPRVSAIVLKGGGHDGFAAYCSDYFYSLLLNFFDPLTGASRATTAPVIAESELKRERENTTLLFDQPPSLTDK